MEELDLLKKDWKKNAGNYPKFSNEDIYRMLHKKSSSIVKWILIISVLEFLLFLSLSIVLSDSKTSASINLPTYVDIGMTVVWYLIIFYFIFQFYRNYRKITTTDSVKNLMKTILHTRKTVSHYIIANITYLIVSMAVMFVLFFNYDAKWLYTLHELEENGKEVWAYIFFIGGAIVGIALFTLAFWLFYKLIYGFLLKRLHRNYQELKKIDF